MATGQAQFAMGETERGLAEIRRGFDMWREASGRFHISWYSSEFADCLLRAAKYDEMDMLLREAEQAVTETDERSHFAELLRIRGVLLVLTEDIPGGVQNLLQAIDLSRRQKAKFFELRALRDLTRLQTSGHDRARLMKDLRAVTSWFPETLETSDLREARDLLQA
jgi:predicted ATPase